MLHFRMNMPFFLMAFYGSVMIAIVLALRAALKNRLPKFVFPVLWGVVLLRLLVPFSISSPLSLPVPGVLSGLSGFSLGEEEGTGVVVEDATQFQPLVPGTSGPVSSDLNFGEEDSTGVENIGQTVAEEVTHGFSERAIPYGVMNSEGLSGRIGSSGSSGLTGASGSSWTGDEGLSSPAQRAAGADKDRLSNRDKHRAASFS